MVIADLSSWSSSFEYDTQFTPSRPRKKRKARSGNERVPLTVVLERVAQEIAACDWLRECKELIRKALDCQAIASPEVLCLGLGSPASSRDARAQLAFLLELCDALSIDRSKVMAYDPVFTEEDVQLLDTVNVQRLTKNRHAAHTIHDPTVAFMPHCDLQLYENILRANWSRERLPKLVLIANRFSEYYDSTPSHKLFAECPCVARLAPHITSRPLPLCPPFPTAFNNISIQFVSPGDLVSMTDDFWEIPCQRPADGDVSSNASIPSQGRLAT